MIFELSSWVILHDVVCSKIDKLPLKQPRIWPWSSLHSASLTSIPFTCLQWFSHNGMTLGKKATFKRFLFGGRTWENHWDPGEPVCDISVCPSQIITAYRMSRGRTSTWSWPQLRFWDGMGEKHIAEICTAMLKNYWRVIVATGSCFFKR